LAKTSANEVKVINEKTTVKAVRIVNNLMAEKCNLYAM
jgi:hypothetical protein